MYQGTISGQMLRLLREQAGVSLSTLAARSHFSKAHLSRVETGERSVTAEIVLAYERAFGDEVDRRGVITGFVALTMAHGKLAGEIYASIAGSDSNPLATVQTTHGTDLVIASMVEGAAMPKLTHWMCDGAEPVLRVNAAGILAKVRGQEMARAIASTLEHDGEVRSLYTTAVLARVCTLDWTTAERMAREPTALSDPRTAARKLSLETLNGRDAGARWCSAYLLRELSPVLGA